MHGVVYGNISYTWPDFLGYRDGNISTLTTDSTKEKPTDVHFLFSALAINDRSLYAIYCSGWNVCLTSPNCVLGGMFLEGRGSCLSD